MKRRKQSGPQRLAAREPVTRLPGWVLSIPPGWWIGMLYLFLPLCATFPLVLSPFQSIYSPTDHVSTDVYASLAVTLWWPKHAVWDLGISPLHAKLLCAPYGQFLSTSFLTGWLVLPVTLLTSPVFVNNLLTWCGFGLSGYFTYLLTFHLTGHRSAGALAGVLFAFCPYMLLRGYTTYDTIQTQWIPLFILAMFRFDGSRSWKDAGLVAGSLIGAMLFSFPYYFIFLPIVAGSYIVIRVICQLRRERDGQGDFLSAFRGLAAPRDLLKIALALVLAAGVLGLHYRMAVSAPRDLPQAKAGPSAKRSIEQQWELRMAVKDYLIPVQQSAIFGGMVKDYWQGIYQTERRNSINSAAYVGYVALGLAGYALYRRRDWKVAFLAVAGILALLTTLGPYLKVAGLEIPTPAWLMFQYASFVRRINAYKVYVQLAVSVLAGVGLSLVLERIGSPVRRVGLTLGLIVAACAEYTIVPPLINTDLTWTPGVYRWLAREAGDPVVLEYPMRKAWGADYQGYYYYQTIHGRRLFNGDVDASFVPPAFRPFWKDMEVPAAIEDGNNQAMLRHLGVKYVLKHHRVQSQNVNLRSLPQPDFEGMSGLKKAYFSSDFRREYRDFSSPFIRKYMPQIVTDPGILTHPHDYIWTDAFEVVADRATVLLTWDYRSPYPTSADASEYFNVRLSQPERDFYPPTMVLLDGGRWTAITQFENACAVREQAAEEKARIDFRPWRMMRNDGRMEALSLLDRAQDFDLLFDAVSFEVPRQVEVWEGDRRLAGFLIGTQAAPFVLKDLHLEREGKLALRIHASGGPAAVLDDQGETREATMAFHNFRVTSR